MATRGTRAAVDGLRHASIRRVVGAAALTVVAATGCVSTLPPVKATYLFDRRCLPVPLEPQKAAPSRLDQPQFPPEPADRSAASRLYSPAAVRVADVMDLLPMLDRLARMEEEQAEHVEIERVRRKLLARVQLATLEVSSIVAEIECEVHRADEVQDRLKSVQTSRTTFQTILAVIFGGLANILSGGISMAVQAGDSSHLASIAGGALEVLFGTSANFTKVRQEFSHPHNHLVALWDGENARTFFPERVWRYLNEPDVRDAQRHSLRQMMLDAWREEGRLGQPGSRQEQERKQLLFGEGGLYDADDLHVREAMLQQLESSIQLMHQDLETLLREILIRQALEDDQ